MEGIYDQTQDGVDGQQQYTYDDYDTLNSVMFPRDHLLRKSGVPEPPIFSNRQKFFFENKMAKYMNGIEPIVEQSNDFSSQKIIHSALKSIPDVWSHKAESRNLLSSGKSKNKMAESSNVSPFIPKTMVSEEFKGSSHSKNLEVHEISKQKQGSFQKQTSTSPKTIQPAICESKSVTLSIGSPQNREKSEGSPLKLVPVMIESKTFYNMDSLKKLPVKEEVELRFQQSDKLKQIEEPTQAFKERSAQFETNQTMDNVEISHDEMFRSREVINIDEESPGFFATSSLENESPPIYDKNSLQKLVQNKDGESSVYENIKALHTAVNAQHYGNLSGLQTLASSIEKKSNEMEKLMKKIVSPEMKAMEGLITGFAKRHSGSGSNSGTSIPLLSLLQCELVDAVWKGNMETINKYLERGQDKTGGYFKTISSSAFNEREVVRHDHILEKLTFKNLRTLKPGQWLNDEVINAYLRLVDGELENSSSRVRVVNTFFFDQYLKDSKNIGKILRILSKKRIDVNKIDVLYIPININNMHWSFVILDLEKGIATYCDSLKNASIPSHKEIVNLGNLLQNQRAKIKEKFIKATLHPSFSKQNNSYDCGVFMLKGIDELARFSKLSFFQQDVDYLRHLICLELLQGKFLQH